MNPKSVMPMQMMVRARAKKRDVSLAVKEASVYVMGSDARMFSVDVEKTMSVATRKDIDDKKRVGMSTSCDFILRYIPQVAVCSGSLRLLNDASKHVFPHLSHTCLGVNDSVGGK
mmetsp:Transcript_50027/g.102023  ORF Transcript_50027/g.102023 Transcript_50027/m.102023 type:complete len:115 (-) Transcript_50027:240-584(-)